MFDKLKGNKYGFFELFNRHAATTLEGAQALLTVSEEFPDIAGKVSRIEELEHECDTITHMTVDLLHHSFITPLDRDEILKLISKMDDVMDLIDRAAKTMLVFELTFLPENLKQMIGVLNRALELVKAGVELIHGFKYGDRLREIIKDIHTLENEGDAFHHAGTIELFRNYADQPILVIKMKQLYETVEEAIDVCEDIADTVESIILEHF